MTVDPFNSGSSATMFVPVGRDADREARRAGVVRGRARVNTAGIALRLNASCEETRDVLEALGLIEPLSGPVPPRVSQPQPASPKPAPGPSTAKPAARKGPRRPDPTLCPKQLHPSTPENMDGSGRCKPCRNTRRRASATVRPGWVSGPAGTARVRRRVAAVARARELLAEEPTVEASPVNEFGMPVLRCSKRVHHKSKPGRCDRCRLVNVWKATIRQFENEENGLEGAA